MRTHMMSWLIALSLWGVMPHAGGQELDLSSLVKLSKQMRAKELAESLSRNSASAAAPVGANFNAPPPPPPPPPPEPPVLKVVLGVNDSLQAELTYDGQSFSLSHGVHPNTGLGPWKHSLLFSEGVLLTTAPVNLDIAKESQSELIEPLSRKPVCQWLNLTSNQCLFLVPTPALARIDASGANKATVFQDQVRNLVSQTPSAPVSYVSPSPPTATYGNGPRATSSTESISMPMPMRTGVFPK